MSDLLRLNRKANLETFISSCTPLAIIESLESEMQTRVDNITNALMRYQSSEDPVENLAGFLQTDADFLGLILNLSKLSQEKFLRILTAERFARGDYGAEWSVNRVFQMLRNDKAFARYIAALFLEGQENEILIRQVASFYLKQLSLPENWSEILVDRKLVENVIRAKLNGEYTDKKGDAIEAIIRAQLEKLAQLYGFEHTKGQVRWLGKEVDHAIPSLEDGYILIMVSYMETTSSSQTARANEQREMFLKLHGQNSRYNEHRIFINFVDGAGWLARRSDLRKLHEDCHYILNLKTLDRLEAIICKYLPEKCFTKQKRPSLIEE